MRGIVWGLTIADAIKKMEQIEEDYERYQTANVVTRRKSNHTCELVYDNGDHWRACGAKESARGCKCNISYVDIRIDPEIVDCIIKPCTVAGPYQAFYYFYDFVK